MIDSVEPAVKPRRGKLITMDEAAALLCMSRDWVAQACRDGIIEHVLVGKGKKQRRFRRLPVRSSVERYIEMNRREAIAERNAIAREHLKRAHLRRFSTVPEVF